MVSTGLAIHHFGSKTVEEKWGKALFKMQQKAPIVGAIPAIAMVILGVLELIAALFLTLVYGFASLCDDDCSDLSDEFWSQAGKGYSMCVIGLINFISLGFFCFLIRK